MACVVADELQILEYRNVYKKGMKERIRLWSMGHLMLGAGDRILAESWVELSVELRVKLRIKLTVES
jgi:hypothetical protein